MKNFGIVSKSVKYFSLTEQEVIEESNDSFRFVDKRICIKMPWKPDMRNKLANNIKVVRKQFDGLVRLFKVTLIFSEDNKKVNSIKKTLL